MNVDKASFTVTEMTVLFALKYSIVLVFYLFRLKKVSNIVLLLYLILQYELNFCVGFHYINNNLEKMAQLD